MAFGGGVRGILVDLWKQETMSTHYTPSARDCCALEKEFKVWKQVKDGMMNGNESEEDERKVEGEVRSGEQKDAREKVNGLEREDG